MNYIVLLFIAYCLLKIVTTIIRTVIERKSALIEEEWTNAEETRKPL